MTLSLAGLLDILYRGVQGLKFLCAFFRCVDSGIIAIAVAVAIAVAIAIPTIPVVVEDMSRPIAIDIATGRCRYGREGIIDGPAVGVEVVRRDRVCVRVGRISCWIGVAHVRPKGSGDWRRLVRRWVEAWVPAAIATIVMRLLAM